MRNEGGTTQEEFSMGSAWISQRSVYQLADQKLGTLLNDSTVPSMFCHAAEASLNDISITWRTLHIGHVALERYPLKIKPAIQIFDSSPTFKAQENIHQ